MHTFIYNDTIICVIAHLGYLEYNKKIYIIFMNNNHF